MIVAKIENGVVYAYDCGNESNWKGKNGNPCINTGFITANGKGNCGKGKIIRVTPPQ